MAIGKHTQITEEDVETLLHSLLPQWGPSLLPPITTILSSPSAPPPLVLTSAITALSTSPSHARSLSSLLASLLSTPGLLVLALQHRPSLPSLLPLLLSLPTRLANVLKAPPPPSLAHPALASRILTAAVGASPSAAALAASKMVGRGLGHVVGNLGASGLARLGPDVLSWIPGQVAPLPPGVVGRVVAHVLVGDVFATLVPTIEVRNGCAVLGQRLAALGVGEGDDDEDDDTLHVVAEHLATGSASLGSDPRAHVRMGLVIGQAGNRNPKWAHRVLDAAVSVWSLPSFVKSVHVPRHECFTACLVALLRVFQGPLHPSTLERLLEGTHVHVGSPLPIIRALGFAVAAAYAPHVGMGSDPDQPDREIKIPDGLSDAFLSCLDYLDGLTDDALATHYTSPPSTAGPSSLVGESGSVPSVPSAASIAYDDVFEAVELPSSSSSSDSGSGSGSGSGVIRVVGKGGSGSSSSSSSSSSCEFEAYSIDLEGAAARRSAAKAARVTVTGNEKKPGFGEGGVGSKVVRPVYLRQASQWLRPVKRDTPEAMDRMEGAMLGLADLVESAPLEEVDALSGKLVRAVVNVGVPGSGPEFEAARTRGLLALCVCSDQALERLVEMFYGKGHTLSKRGLILQSVQDVMRARGAAVPSRLNDGILRLVFYSLLSPYDAESPVLTELGNPKAASFLSVRLITTLGVIIEAGGAVHAVRSLGSHLVEFLVAIAYSGSAATDAILQNAVVVTLLRVLGNVKPELIWADVPMAAREMTLWLSSLVESGAGETKLVMGALQMLRPPPT